jgi:GTPase-activator protein for Ras-like GTPase
MRQLFEYIRQLVEERYPNGHGTDTKNDLPRQSVSAFCFLRFIVPAILHPHLFGLCSGRFFLMGWKGYRFENNVSGLPDLLVQRSLTLIAKVIQSLANLNTVGLMSFVVCIISDQAWIDGPQRRVHARDQVLPRGKITGDAGLHPRSIYTRPRGLSQTTIGDACPESCHQGPL